MKEKKFCDFFALQKRHKKLCMIAWCFFVIFMGVSSASFGDTLDQKRITLEVSNTSLKHCIEMIEQQTGYGFLYNKKVITNVNGISVNLRNSKIEEVLSEVLKETDYTYKVKHNVILLTKKQIPRAVKIQQEKSTIKVTGKVTDSSGTPLPGVTVMVVGSTRGVLTDPDGNYDIDVQKTDKLRFSFIGMVTSEVAIDGRSNINISLKDKTEELEDITIVAFGKQKKESVLSSIETVNVAELQVPTSNLTQALSGRMAGLISYQRSGEPGQDNTEFFIRGVTTFGYSKSPLILIDGIELSASDLSRLNTDDVQSFSIMKDATATALYGAKGANGVILVTTKEGREGKATIEMRLEHSISTPTTELDVADPITYMMLNNEAVRTRSPLGIMPYTESKIGNTIKGTNPYVYPATDWHDLLFQDYTANTRFNMNISGGGKVAQYYIAASAKQDNGNLKVDTRNNFNSNIKLNKYLLRSNLSINVTPTTKMKFRFHGTFDDYSGPLDGGSSVYKKVYSTSPVDFPAYYEPSLDNEFTNHILFGNNEFGNAINPYADMVKGYKEYSRTLVLAQFELSENLSWITDGLKFRLMANTNRKSYFDLKRQYDPYFYQHSYYDRPTDKYTLTALNPKDGKEYLGYKEGEKEISSSYYVQTAIDYSKTIQEKHSLSGMLLCHIKQSLKANAGDLQKSLAYRNIGVAGRFTYAYNQKYLTEFNFGYNGSERFSKGERFGFFPSVGLGWIISKEEFFTTLKDDVTKLKLKVTHGLSGSDNIGSSDDRFFYLSRVSLDDSGRGMNFGEDNGYGSKGVKTSRYENSMITWELATKTNFALELGLWDKLDIQAEYFSNDRENILYKRVIPADVGLAADVKANIGRATSSGFDLSVDYQQSFSQDFWITFRGNFTFSKGKYKEIEEPDYSKTPWLSKVGQPLGQRWGYIAERLFIDEEDIRNSPEQTFGDYLPGDIKYRDINNDGKISELDKVPIGHPTSPQIEYGFGNSIKYKNIDFNFFFQGNARTSFWIDAYKTAPFIDSDSKEKRRNNNALLNVYANDYWSEANPSPYALWPRLSTYQVKNNTQTSTWFMQNGAFIRLKSVELGYSLPKSLIKRIGAKKCRVYASASNLFTISAFDLWDPEMAGNAFNYPLQRVFNIGLELKF